MLPGSNVLDLKQFADFGIQLSGLRIRPTPSATESELAHLFAARALKLSVGEALFRSAANIRYDSRERGKTAVSED